MIYRRFCGANTHMHMCTHTHMVYERDSDLDLSDAAVLRCNLVALKAPRSFSPALLYTIVSVCGITGRDVCERERERERERDYTSSLRERERERERLY